MEKKKLEKSKTVYIVTYASFIDEDTDIYTEVKAYGTREEAVAAIKADYKYYLEDEDANEEGLVHVCTEEGFTIKSSGEGVKVITEKIGELHMDACRDTAMS